MDRTLRASLSAALIAFVAVAGLGVFLGFDVAPSLVAGAAVAAMAGLLLWGASRRADSFHPTDVSADDHGPPVSRGDLPSDSTNDSGA